MKKNYLLFVLFLSYFLSYGQEPIQEAYVTKTLTVVDEEWQEVTFSKMIKIASNKKGQLKIDNAEFLTLFSGEKAIMLENSAYTTATLNTPLLTKEKIDKNGLVNLVYEGKLVFKTHDGTYAPNVKVTYIINKADIIGLLIYNKENSKDFVLNLEIIN